MNEQIPDFEPTRVRTSRDLQHAADAMLAVLDAVEKGDLTRRVELDYADDDPIGVLATCVNSMTMFLAERREETLKIQQELEGQLATIEKQQLAIRELSTPIIEIWRGVLCAPIVGVLDSSRASEMTNAL